MSDHDDGYLVPKIGEDQHIEWLSETIDPIIDLKPYREHIGDLELSDEEAEKFLGILWNIMSHFVDLGFGVDAVSLIEHLSDQASQCGKGSDDSRPESTDMVKNEETRP
ncbi:MAG: hypothetical protein AAF583_13120 [Pseudomonadota bacterium]